MYLCARRCESPFHSKSSPEKCCVDCDRADESAALKRHACVFRSASTNRNHKNTSARSSLKSDFAAGKKNPGPRGPGLPSLALPQGAMPRAQARLDRRVIAVWQTRHGIGSARAARTLPTADCHPWRDPFGSSQVVVAGAAGQRPPRHTYRRRPVSRLLPAEPDAAASARGLTRQPLPAQLRGKLKKRAASYRGVTSTSSCKTM